MTGTGCLSVCALRRGDLPWAKGANVTSKVARARVRMLVIIPDFSHRGDSRQGPSRRRGFRREVPIPTTATGTPTVAVRAKLRDRVRLGLCSSDIRTQFTQLSCLAHSSPPRAWTTESAQGVSLESRSNTELCRYVIHRHAADQGPVTRSGRAISERTPHQVGNAYRETRTSHETPRFTRDKGKENMDAIDKKKVRS